MDPRTDRLLAPGDIATATALLTRLPVPFTADRAAAAAWAYPVTGLFVATLAAAVASLALAFGLPPALAAGLVLAIQVIVTGAMHEDGLADSADGLWGGWTRARRLEIMRDSRIGTYGVLALVLVTGLRWAALTAIILPSCPPPRMPIVDPRFSISWRASRSRQRCGLRASP